MPKASFEINDEFCLRIFRHGVQLVEPDKTSPQLNIGEIFDYPLQSYFYDSNDTFLRVNKHTALVNGFASENDAIKRSLNHVVSQTIADRIKKNNAMVLSKKEVQILEEFIIRNDGIFVEGISIKFPFYDSKIRLIGIFGCSFVIDSVNSYAQALKTIAQTGLLNIKDITPGYSADSYYFSKREKDILYLLVRGKTAREIAAALQLSKRTVEHYLENVKIKTRLSTKSELIEKFFYLFS